MQKSSSRKKDAESPARPVPINTPVFPQPLPNAWLPEELIVTHQGLND